jgi:hypothetical protein
MKQYEAVIKVMEENGGYATLGSLNQRVLKVEGCEWKTNTPFASIRRIVQDDRFFFKIRPGLWALKAYKDKLPPEICPAKDQPKAKQAEYSHTYYQGLLVEIGNLKKFETYVPNQDKNKAYLGKKLGEVSTIDELYTFTYERIIQRVRSVDVIWFNVRKMPNMLFEIEHSSDINNSLSKFVEVQDFYTDFCIVADVIRQNEFKTKLTSESFRAIHSRVKFLSYDYVSQWHSKTNELVRIEENFGEI